MCPSIDHKQNGEPTEVSWLTRHRDAYLGELSRLGYPTGTIGYYSRAIGLFCEQITERGLDAGDIDEAVLAELQDAVPKLQSAKRQRGRQGCIARFIAHLVDAGVIAPPTPPALPAPGSIEHLRATYGDWLRQQQGLSQTTIKKRQAFLERFMTFRFGAALGELNDITPEDLLRFLEAPQTTTGGFGRGDRATHLRSLFRFLFSTGEILEDLIPLGVPRISSARARGLSRHMPPVEVRKLIGAIHDHDGRGRRNYAMLLLMARLGLRAEEVIAIRLDDINWPASKFLVRGKGGQHDRMPLLPDIGEAIVAYVRDGRTGTSRHLFVSCRAPYRPFASSQVINRVLHEAFARTDLTPPNGEVRSHVLRHSLAVDMLGRGASLDEVGEVLRHRSFRTTTIYARYDIEALRTVARRWPVSGAVR